MARKQPDVRVRLSAEGQEEIIAAFQKISQEAAAAEGAGGRAGRRTADASRDAAQAVGLMSRQFGIMLPRSVQRYVASLQGAERALAAAFKLGVVTAIVGAFVAALPKLAGWIDHLRGINREMAELGEHQRKLQAGLFDPASVAEARERVAEVRRELQRLEQERANRSFAFRATDFLTNKIPGLTTESKRQIEQVTERLRAAEDIMIRAGVTADKSGEQQKRRLTEEIELLGKTEAQRIRILGTREREAIQARFTARDISAAQRDELLGLSRAKEALELKAAAAKGADSETRRALRAAAALAEAGLAFDSARLEQELALLRAQNLLRLNAEQEFFDAGISGLEDFFATRRQIITQEAEREVSIFGERLRALQQRLATEQARPLAKGELPDERARLVLQIEQQIATLQSQSDLKRLEVALALASLSGAERDAARQLLQDRARAEGELLEAQGLRFTAARHELETQIALMRRFADESDAAFLQRQTTVREAGLAGIAFEESQARAREALAALAAERERIQQQVESGQLFQFQGEERIIALERSRLPVLRQIVEEMRAAAVTPEQVAAAEELAQSLERMAIASDSAAQRMAQIKAGLEGGVRGGIFDFLTRGALEAENFGEAMRDLALSVAQSLQRIAADLLAAELTKRLLGLFGVGKSNPEEQVATAAAAGAAQAAPLAAAAGAMSAAGAAIAAGGATATAGGAALASGGAAVTAGATLATTAGATIAAGAGVLTAAAAATLAAAIQLQIAANTLLVANTASAVGGFASGGLVTGPGTGTSDSIAARLSDWEFVVRSSVVREPGMLAFLRSLNREGMPALKRLRAPGFAEGGLVESAAGALAAARGGGGLAGEAALRVALDAPLLLAELEATPEFPRMLLRVADRNRKKMRAALGMDPK